MIRLRTLFAKLLLLFLCFAGLMTGMFVLMMRVSHETYHLEVDQLVNHDLAKQYVAAHLLVREPPLTAHNFANALDRITSINPNIDVYVLDERGDILAGSATDRQAAKQRVDVEPIRRFLTGRAELPLLGDDPVDPAHPEVFSAAPLSIPGCAAAYLYIVLNRHGPSSAASRLKATYAIGEGAGFLVAAIVLAFIASIVFLRMLTRRLGTLQQDIERFRDSGAAPAAALGAVPADDDEVGRLRRLFLQLTARIGQQVDELRRSDEMRREFLANVSHDLRTPLTILHAHLETLTFKEDLTAEERTLYLAVASRQCERLVRLVEQLLEAARLDAGQVNLSAEAFQIAELVQDVAQKSRLPARHLGVRLVAAAPEQSVPLVLADVALIERVLDNLVDNAVRHAGHGGQVTMQVTVKHAAVRVSVHNTGEPISAEERARIFERFYRGRRSRSSESGHAGLGLAIVRAILSLHGRDIELFSEPQAGTTFAFELPVAGTAGDLQAHGAGLLVSRPDAPSKTGE